ncbi:MAG: DUF5615 family PIN-like protein [Phycisphaerae bacterium]|nr:DUF5615 family PIN-like protein [Phycisphaerae bacterium]
MATPIRYHLDENVDGAVADGLRRRGIDVTTAADARLPGAVDERHLHFAVHEGRVIFTHDADFLRLEAKGREHPGIVFCHIQSRSIGQMVRGLAGLWLRSNTEEMRNRIEYL